VNAAREGHGGPDPGLPGGLMHVLTRWESSEGRWRILESREGWLTVGFYAGDGDEAVGHVTAARTSVLEAYVAGRLASDDRPDDGQWG
jgi:hypothetical protein